MNTLSWAQNLINRALSAGIPGLSAPCSITLNWVEYASPDTDPVTGAYLSSPQQKSQTITGLVHYVQPVQSDVRLFAELQVGDAILDLPAAASFTGKQNVTFTIDGQVWTQKKISERLTDYWDVLIGNERLYRTVAVQKAT